MRGHGVSKHDGIIVVDLAEVSCLRDIRLLPVVLAIGSYPPPEHVTSIGELIYTRESYHLGEHEVQCHRCRGTFGVGLVLPHLTLLELA